MVTIQDSALLGGSTEFGRTPETHASDLSKSCAKNDYVFLGDLFVHSFNASSLATDDYYVKCSITKDTLRLFKKTRGYKKHYCTTHVGVYSFSYNFVTNEVISLQEALKLNITRQITSVLQHDLKDRFIFSRFYIHRRLDQYQYIKLEFSSYANRRNGVNINHYINLYVNGALVYDVCTTKLPIY